MANEIRIRRNNIGGTITDNPLTNVATTINSPGFVDLPTIDATNHLILVLDPLETNGPAEIVRVTTHAAASAQVTVTRGAEGSAARTHVNGTTWYHGPVTSDTVEVLTSGTRPAVPYEGQMIYETDTDIYKSYNGSAWVDLATPLGGAWTSWTPTFTNFTLGNGTLTAGYTRSGRTITFALKVVLGTTSSMGTNPQYTFPVEAASRYSGAALDEMGQVHISDIGTVEFSGPSVWLNSTAASFYVWGAGGTYINAIVVTATVPMVWTTGDGFMITGTYEAAS